MPLTSRRAQPRSGTSLTKAMSILSVFVACVFAIAMPCVYYAISINGEQRSLAIEAAFLQKSIEKIIQSRPNLWEFEYVRLKEVITQPPIRGHDHELEIRNVAGKLVTKTDFTASLPIISVSRTLFDSGRLAGSIVVRHSIRTQIIITALLGILSSLLGFLFYFIFRTYPIRKLENAFIDLQRERDKSDKTLYAIGDGVISVDHKGKILLMNRVAESLLGMDTSEAVGRPLEEVYVLRQGQEKKAGKMGCVLISKGGNEYAIEEVRTPLSGMETEESGVVIIFRDITGRNRAEEALQQAHDELEQRVAERTEELRQANEKLRADINERMRAEEEKRSLEERLRRSEKMEALGQLAGGVAHDLNNVLGVLTGYSELLLLEIPEGHRSRSNAEKILLSTEKGAAIIQDLLTMARRGVTASEVINLNSVVSGFLKTPVFEKVKHYHPRVTFRVECDQNLLNIKGSSLHLEKTLMNLVSNAAEAISGKGEVTIRTKSRYLDESLRGYDEIKEGDYTVLTVSDTGMGIPAENREKIFEPFYTKKTMGRSGTGLGLAIVWGTVKDHNGYIDVQSEAGEGTTFALYFPVTREEQIAPQQKEPMEQFMGKGESVLVVDDIAEQRDIAARLLTRLGYEVHSVSSGEEAVGYLTENKADILVLDMIMSPGIDGCETYQRVLEIKPQQKAILVSGFSETDRVKEAQRLGAGAYVKKPYVMEKIGVAIRDELNR